MGKSRDFMGFHQAKWGFHDETLGYLGDIAWRLESTTSRVKILDGHGACALIPGMRCWIVRWGSGATDYVCILAMTRKRHCLHEAWWVRFDGQDISWYFNLFHDISLWQVGWHQRGPLGMFMINIHQLWSSIIKHQFHEGECICLRYLEAYPLVN